ncbi:sigma-70 family RNA polymerase sigma factor [bacterium]|nr:sigma-70 family RNA polymerase sigma factor [bacterium]
MDDLLESLAQGDDNATEEVFQRCEPLLRMVIRRQISRDLQARFDAEDILQSIWADLVVGFRAGSWQFNSSAELRAFLILAARNRLIDRARQANAQSRFQTQISHDRFGQVPAQASPTPSEWAQANDLWDQLLDLCPPQHRVIVEKKRDGMSLKEIAESTQLHPSSIRRILYDLARRLGNRRTTLD